MKPHRPAWTLKLQAQFWRVMMAFGMWIGGFARPWPMKAAFVRTIPTTLSPNSGSVKIHFYVPLGYETTRKLDPKKKYPCVVNFHGGGFTIGSATDDSRWASCVVQEVDAIVASVEYRLAPEHPFPTAIEDGVDAIMYISKHADELHIDPEKLAVSGFSSGGNMAFTVPLRLQEELQPDFLSGNVQNMENIVHPLKSDPETREVGSIAFDHRDFASGGASSPRVQPEGLATGPDGALSPTGFDLPTSSTTIVRITPPINIAAVVSWYPSTDYTQTRDERRATNSRQDLELSSTFTELFDSSYLQPGTVDLSNPYLSPGVAPEHVLSGLPANIIMFICEFDMLAAEGRRMRDRLEELDKHVHYTEVKGVPHGWDKNPNPLQEVPGLRENYKIACRELKRAFRRHARRNMPEADRKDSIDSKRMSFSLPRLSFASPRRSVEEGRGKWRLSLNV